MNKDILKVLQERYFLKNEKSWNDIAERISKLYKPIRKYIEEFIFIPSSPTLMNACTKERVGTFSSCFTLDIEDSIEGIFDAAKEAAIITKMGGGVGYDFSKLRSHLEPVKGIGGKKSSGPVYFISLFSKILDVIIQGGSRRGAGMAQLDVYHPDIINFIRAKEDYRNENFRRFNFSVRFPNSFFEILLKNPNKEFKVKEVTTKREISLEKKYTYKDIWNIFITCNKKSSEPGAFFYENAQKRNPIKHIENHMLTNPCGELISIPYNSCNLGSINLSKFIANKTVDYKNLEIVVRKAVRFLNSVIDNNIYPLEKIKETTLNSRPIGLGVMGLAHLLFKLGIPYDSNKARELTENIVYFITIIGFHESAKIAEEKSESYKFLKKSGGIEAFLDAYDYLFEREETYAFVSDIRKSIEKGYMYNSQITVIAPTGTISYIAESSSGIEPVFYLVAKRNIEKKEGFESTVIVDKVFYDYISKKYSDKKDKIFEEITENNGSCQNSKILNEHEKEIFKTALDIKPIDHVNMLSSVVHNITSAVSKTINMSSNVKTKEIEEVYLEAYRKKLLGLTIYVEGSRGQGVVYSVKRKNPQDLLTEIKNNYTYEEVVKSKDVKIPNILLSKRYRFRSEGKNWYIHVGFFDNSFKPFELFITTNSKEKYTDIKNSITNLFELAKEKGIYGNLIQKEKEKIKEEKENIFKLSRTISFLLRHGISVLSIIRILENEKPIVGTVFFYIVKVLKEFVEGAIVSEKCPICSGKVIYSDGCIMCINCGWSKCS